MSTQTVGAPRLRSVRVRLMLLVLLPMVGLLTLAVAQAGSAAAAISDASRGVVMADAATASAGLVHELERELAETVALRDRGGSSGKALVTVQRGRTDAALRRYEAARDAALGAAVALAPAYAAAGAQLDHLPAARTDPGGTGDRTYRDITAAVVEVGQALPNQLTDPHLAGQARAIAELTAATHALAQQRDLVRAVLTRGSYPATDQASLAGLAAVERERRDAFLRAADAEAVGVRAPVARTGRGRHHADPRHRTRRRAASTRQRRGLLVRRGDACDPSDARDTAGSG